MRAGCMPARLPRIPGSAGGPRKFRFPPPEKALTRRVDAGLYSAPMKALIVLIVLAAVGAFAYPRFFKPKDPYPPPPGVAVGSREHLKDIASRIKAQLPKQVDEELTATDIFAREGEMVYTYKLVNYSSREIDGAKFRDLVQTDLRRRICREREIKAMWKHHDLTFSFQFIAKDGFSLGYLSVNRADC